MEHADMYSMYPKLAQAFAEDLTAFPHNLVALHPRLANKIEGQWGTKDCVRTLEDLMLSDRPDRQGFTFDVLRELFVLKELHDAKYPQFLYNGADPFSAVVSDVVRADVERRREQAKQEGTGLRARHKAPEEVLVVKPAKAADQAEKEKPQEAAAEKPAEKTSKIARLKTKWPEIENLDELRRIMAARARGERLPERDKRQMVELLKHYVDLDEKDIANAIKIQASLGKKREPIGKILLMMGVIDEEYITRALCLQYGVLMVNLQRFQIPPEVIKLIPLDVARKHRAVPVAMLEGVLFLAVENPFSFNEREYFAFLTKRKIELVMASTGQITHRLAEYGQVQSVKQGAQEFKTLASKALGDKAVAGITIEAEPELEAEESISQDDASIVGLVNKIISDAAEIGASDIHIECFPGEALAHIRFRRDGLMEEYSQYSAQYHRAVVSRIKIMSSLNIAERRLPQDGKISFVRPGKERLDLRVATIPTTRGIENVTIRLLHAGEPLPIDQLKMSERDMAVFRRLIAKPYGLFLVCGPTGSGKTTTLHSALRELNTPEKKIWTAEDPVEIVQKNISQVQVNAQIGWTFAMALRAFLRADPDIIMIGEMRDLETAKIAVEASMTGHLVLSTLHTNSASETAARLLDLGMDPFNLADAMIGVLAQRLTRRLCAKCAEPRELSLAEAEELAAEYYFSAYQRLPSMAEKEAILHDWQERLMKGKPVSLWQAGGCAVCANEGYKGRVALFEMLEVTPQIRELIAHRASAADFQRIAVVQGMRTLKQDGIEKAIMGLTDMNQVRAVCN
ncbi:MAG: ATPase, T2SS/T4P/T4SS family [Rhodocyclaceae bacterium]|nr:ATPase, T2SS/T4P/T4SS family [Rhodocyclaceae bacterium]